MADADILLGGFGLFGGRGEYTGKIKVSYPVTNRKETRVSSLSLSPTIFLLFSFLTSDSTAVTRKRTASSWQRLKKSPTNADRGKSTRCYSTK